MNDPVISHTVAVSTRWAAKKKRFVLLQSDVDGLIRLMKSSCNYKETKNNNRG